MNKSLSGIAGLEIKAETSVCRHPSHGAGKQEHLCLNQEKIKLG